MSCTNLLQAKRCLDGSIRFVKCNRDVFLRFLKFQPDEHFFLPCKRCISCRMNYSREWAIRCMHEASLHENNIFLTLTYDHEFLPEGMTLVKKDVQDFMKRLRERVLPSPLPEGHPGIRVFYCGEYGEKKKRPHYHLCLFNFFPSDARLHNRVEGYNLFTSAFLEDVWGKGFCPFGSVTFQSAAYTARYICKKIYGDDAESYYDGRVPEFSEPSRSPGLAYEWISKFWKDVYPRDYCRYKDEYKCKPPRYYDEFMKKFHPDVFEEVMTSRKANALLKGFEDHTIERMKVKAAVRQSRFNQLIRSLERDL